MEGKTFSLSVSEPLQRLRKAFRPEAPEGEGSAALWRRPLVLTTALICLGFLMTSTGWLAWEYHLMTMISWQTTECMTMVAGYALQAVGLALFALILRKQPDKADFAIYTALVLHMLMMVPAVLSPSLLGTLAFGFLLNVCIGVIAGGYLHALAACSEAAQRGKILGAGYAMSILFSWLLSRIGGGSLYYSNWVLLICLAMAALTGFAVWIRSGQAGPTADETPADTLKKEQETTAEDGLSGEKSTSSAENTGSSAARINRSAWPLARGLAGSIAGLILLVSIVNSCSFSFSVQEISPWISIEFSRLFYAAGLLVAGFVTDRSRKAGAILALGALMMPFLLMALRGEPVSGQVFWVLCYFTFGFYTIYRVIVFTDLSDRTGQIFLCGLGLMIGRIGDAAGEGLSQILANHSLGLIGMAALLFAGSMVLFFRVYAPLYLTASKGAAMDERAFFHAFATRHDLSQRESDVLRMLLAEKSSAEIAESLCVSDSTVKYHVHNLLQKTGQRNRLDLIRAYYAAFHAQQEES